eukprot:scaffold24337_cov82-Cyclotella_meneghiniana.AAC.9
MLYLTRILSNCAIARQVSCADTQALADDVVMGHGSRFAYGTPFTLTAHGSPLIVVATVLKTD